MNVYDSEKIRSAMLGNGYVESIDANDSDIIIFYTCNVREKAAEKLFSDIGRISGKKDKIIAVGGCVAQAEKEGIFKRAPDVRIVFGPHVYHKLPEYIKKIDSGIEQRIIDVTFAQKVKFGHLPKKSAAKASEFVSIQEGCDNFCTYCTVPYVRGREYSRPSKDIIGEIVDLIDRGTKEITLLGQNVNSYHSDVSFEELLRSVLKISGLRRLRYTSSHPKDFTTELMAIHNEYQNILPPFVHIPVQSGSDRILDMMNRGHTISEYLQKLRKFRNICKSVSFSSDFIVGFPGETEADFQDTIDLAKEAKFSSFYAFIYSRRKETPAYNMPNQVPLAEKKRRFEELLRVLRKEELEFNKNCVGSTQRVLFEKRGKKENQYIGYSEYMQSVVVENDSENIIGTFGEVLIKEGFQNCLIGKLNWETELGN
jgi:tRNA-2-methylthio-N6-dimethylallyladenosine synthase